MKPDAAVRIHARLTESDEHGNYQFRATAPIYAADANGALLELATVGELLELCELAIAKSE